MYAYLLLVFGKMFKLIFTRITPVQKSKQLKLQIYLNGYRIHFVQWCRLHSFFVAIWVKFAFDLVLIWHQNLKIYAEIAYYIGAILDEFSKQY